ncbi:MAG: hypothetical protein ACYC6W_01465 [Nitrosotalea sp.]
MKTISIVTTMAIIVISATSIGVFIGKVNDHQQQPYLNITINGLQENYTVNEPLSFSITLEGYGTGCGDTKATITRENDTQFQSLGWMSLSQCVSNPTMHDFKYNPISANTKINQTGAYLLTVTFDDRFEHQKTMVQRFSVMSDNPSSNVIINANGGRPLDIAMNINEINVNGQPVPNNLPLILHGGENVTLKIEIISKVSETLSLQMRVFNNIGNYPNLAFARVKFAGDASGLPNGLVASFGNNTIAMNTNGRNHENLFLTVGQTTKAGNYQIGVLGLVTINSPDGVKMGNSQTLLIPITIK